MPLWPGSWGLPGWGERHGWLGAVSSLGAPVSPAGAGDLVLPAALGVAGDFDVFGVLVFQAVVPIAGGCGFVDVGEAAVGPVVDVVELAASGGDVAADECAGFVEGFDDAALCWGEEAGLVAEVERGSVGVEQEQAESGVEGDDAGLLGADGGAVGEPGSDVCVFQGPVRDGARGRRAVVRITGVLAHKAGPVRIGRVRTGGSVACQYSPHAFIWRTWSRGRDLMRRDRDMAAFAMAFEEINSSR